MSDEKPNSAGAAESPSGAQFQLQRIYLKDLSFESPMMISAIRPQWQPKVNQDLNTSVNKLDGDVYEVILKMTINVEAEGATAFLVEVQQAGLFVIKGVEGPQLAQVLNTMCPQILYPYAREVIDSCATRGGFPALALPPINFDVLFARALQESRKAQADKQTADASIN